jgi:hypothetical protein
MVDPTPDPVDQAYRDAETRLTKQTERSVRRARVLAAVAQDEVVNPAVRPGSAPRFASRYGWLVAASVMVVSGYLVLRFLPTQQFGAPPTAQTAAIKSPQKNQMTAALSRPAPVPDLSAPAPTANTSDQAPIVTHERTGSPGNRAVPAAPPPPVAMIAPSPPITAAPTSPLPPPGIAPAPPPAAVAAAPPPSMVARLAPYSPPAAAPVAPPPAAAPAPALRTDAAKPMGELGTNPGFEELRAAAGAGRTAEVQELLDRHIPVDNADADGETALIKSVRADQPATAALLIRNGASLGKKNNAGFSARDLATQVNDPALKRALGIEP